MIFSVVYLCQPAVRRLLSSLVMRTRRDASKDAELLVVRHELPDRPAVVTTGHDTSASAADDARIFWEVVMLDLHEEILKSMRASPVILSRLAAVP